MIAMGAQLSNFEGRLNCIEKLVEKLTNEVVIGVDRRITETQSRVAALERNLAEVERDVTRVGASLNAHLKSHFYEDLTTRVQQQPAASGKPALLPREETLAEIVEKEILMHRGCIALPHGVFERLRAALARERERGDS